jgi:hypothetical protein
MAVVDSCSRLTYDGTETEQLAIRQFIGQVGEGIAEFFRMLQGDAVPEQVSNLKGGFRLGQRR